MIYITQLIYLKPGAAAVFDEFEALALPIITKHNGTFLLRLRPTPDTFVLSAMPPPYEVHLVSFATAADFERFMHDETRKSFLHLKAQAIESVFLVKGERV
jgi:hypothetical protein